MCDFAMTSREGKLSIIGIFDRMFVVNTPAKFTRFFIVSTLEGEPGSEHKITFNVKTPSGKKLMEGKEMTIKLGGNGKSNTITDISNFPLPEIGEYRLSILEDGKTIDEKIFAVSKVTTESDTKAQNLPN